MENLAERLIGVLGRSEALALARTEEERPAVGGEGDHRSELAALAVRAGAPEHLHRIEPWRPAVEIEDRPRQSQRAAARARLGIGKIDRMTGGEIGGQRDVEQAALATISDLRSAMDIDLRLAGLPQLHRALLLGDQGAAVRKKDHRPGFVEIVDLGDLERLAACAGPAGGRAIAGGAARTSAAAKQEQKQGSRR